MITVTIVLDYDDQSNEDLKCVLSPNLSNTKGTQLLHQCCQLTRQSSSVVHNSVALQRF